MSVDMLEFTFKYKYMDVLIKIDLLMYNIIY